MLHNHIGFKICFPVTILFDACLLQFLFLYFFQIMWVWCLFAMELYISTLVWCQFAYFLQSSLCWVLLKKGSRWMSFHDVENKLRLLASLFRAQNSKLFCCANQWGWLTFYCYIIFLSIGSYVCLSLTSLLLTSEYSFVYFPFLFHFFEKLFFCHVCAWEFETLYQEVHVWLTV